MKSSRLVWWRIEFNAYDFIYYMHFYLMYTIVYLMHYTMPLLHF